MHRLSKICLGCNTDFLYGHFDETSDREPQGENMTYWKWGVHFGGAPANHYHFMRAHNIIIGHQPDTPYDLNDLVVVTDGFTVKAIARVDSLPEPITNRSGIEAECVANAIDFIPTTIVADAEWDDYAFWYRLVMAGNQIHDEQRIAMIQAIWDQRH